MQKHPQWVSFFPGNIYDNPEMLEKISTLPYFKEPTDVFDSNLLPVTLWHNTYLKRP